MTKMRNAHNKIPFEHGYYLQLLHNPLDRDQFITVKQVKRLKKLDLGFQKDSLVTQVGINLAAEALLGN